MKIERLFEIVYILLSQKTRTAREMAGHFGVSVRTIYRDIDTLSGAGIPIYSCQGKGGGIRLLEGFVLNKSILSEAEQSEILAALQGLRAAVYPEVEGVLRKLGAFFNKSESSSWVEVDFSNWSVGDKKKFQILKKAILGKKIVSFEYYNSSGEKTSRRAQPLQLWFKDKSWYVKAFCMEKQAFRIFKNSRIKNIVLTEENFIRALPEQECKLPAQNTAGKIAEVKLHLQSCMAYRVYDEFDEKDIQKNQDGSFTVCFAYPEDEWVFGYILSFGYFAEVLEPVYIREIITERLEKTLQKYKQQI